MKYCLAIILGFTHISISRSQPFGPNFTSRVELELFSPEIISNKNIKRVRIVDHMMDRIYFDYEFQFDKRGLLKSYKFGIEGNETKQKRIKVKPIDIIFYNNVTVDSIVNHNKIVWIEYSNNKKIEKVSFKYKEILIGCPIKAIYFQYDSSARVLKDIVVNCQDSIISNHKYSNAKISETTCTIYKVNRLNGILDKNPQKEQFEYIYDNCGLIIGIRQLDNPERFKKYSYIINNNGG